MGFRVLPAVAAACIASLMAACATVETPPAPAGGTGLPPGFPEAYYREAAARGTPVYRIDSAASLVVIEVRRTGSLARLGHDHVVASRDIAGYVAPDIGRADIAVPLARLEVDDAALRAEAGFDTQPAASDIAATRNNMMNAVLEVERFPWALIRVNRVDRGAERLDVAITLHGTTRTMVVPARVESSGGALAVVGRFSLDQSDFGIVPYAILGGAIAVRDRLDLRFTLRATRIGSGS